MLMLDLLAATSHVMERKFRDMIAQWPRSAFKPLKLRPEELDACEAQVRDLETDFEYRPLNVDNCKEEIAMDPVTLGLGMGGAQLLGGGLSFLGQNSQSKSVRQAMERYINEVNRQRETFLNQPESTAIRSKLQSYIGGDVGYSPDTVEGMKKGVYEDYGKSLADMTRLTQKAGAGSTGVYTPGRADRTARLLGQNIAANRATSIRDINQKNADVALNNQRFAISALPTYMPGTPATNVPGADVFLKAGETPGLGSFLGPAFGQAANTFGNMAFMGPVYERMAQSPYLNPPGSAGMLDPSAAALMGAYSYGNIRSLYPTF